MARKRGLVRADVVRVAGEIADAHGLDEVSLAGVAERLGIRSPSLYAHVDGLAGLRRELALAAAAAMTEAFREAMSGLSGEEALRALAIDYRRYARRHPGHYEAAQRAVAPGEDEELYEALAGVANPVFQVLAEMGAAGPDRVHLTRAFRSALHGFVVLEEGGGFGMPESVDESFRRMVDMLISGVRSAAERAGEVRK
jgi:AcrR family transcriptional regulator